MSKYPTVPTTLPAINPDNSVEQNIQVLKSYQISTCVYKPTKPSGALPTSADGLRKMADEFDQYEIEKDKFDYWASTVNDYNAAIDQLTEDYIKSEAGFERVPEKSRAKVWTKAWRDGHSAGYHEVFYHLRELVELFD